jgi:hypothetical protein
MAQTDNTPSFARRLHVYDALMELVRNRHVDNRYWQLNFLRSQNTHHLKSGHRPAPFSKRTHPKIAVVLSTDWMPTEVEEITDGCMGTQKSLRLPH